MKPKVLSIGSTPVRLYVPGMVDPARPVENTRWVDAAIAYMSTAFGGATAIMAYGGWLSPTTGELVKEPVTVVTSMTAGYKAEGAQEKYQALLNFVAELCREMAQEAILVEIDGEALLVSADVQQHTAAA